MSTLFMKNLLILRKIFNLTQNELSSKINIDEKTIANYEIGNRNPSLNNLIKFSEFYKLSLDFIILSNNCYCPKNLKLLGLAKKLDELTKAEARNSIEYNAKSFLNEKINEKIITKFDDDMSIVLTDKFNSNLKELRISQKLKQRELADSIGVSRSLLSKYEENSYPPIEKIIKLSEIFNISIHALATGVKLIFNFTDGHFGKIMLIADQLLPLEQQKTLITLMEAILQTQPATL